MYKVVYNGVELHEYIDILNIEKNVLPPRVNFNKDIPGMHGRLYTGHKYEPMLINLKCYMECESLEEQELKVRTIADILNTDGPCKLIISSEEDKYYYAVLDGDTDRQKWYIDANINIPFICYDPFAYAVEDSYFEMGQFNIIEVENSGTLEAKPITTINFNKKAQFLQLQKYDGKAILVGGRNNLDSSQAEEIPKFIERCEDTINFLPATGGLDGAIDTQAEREIMGDIEVNAGGYAIVPTNFGTHDDKWHGPAKRRNLPVAYENFEVDIVICHNSKGDLKEDGASLKPPAQTKEYYIAVDLKLREKASSSSAQVILVPKGTKVTVTNIANGWGKTTYKSKSGYLEIKNCSTVKIPKDPKPDGKYMTSVKADLRSGRGSKYKLITTMPKGTQITITSISKGWGKTTYKGKTGYIYMNNAKKLASTKMVRAVSKNQCEDQIGRVEVYGYDTNGQKLFKFVARDSQAHYEYTEPEVWIANEKVLSDRRNCPDPLKGYFKEDDKYLKKSMDSGRFGDWNELRGNFKIRRVTKKGKQLWYAEISKETDGKIVRTIKTKELCSSSYGNGKLASLVVWFGQYKNNPPVEIMSVNHIVVKDPTYKYVAPKPRYLFAPGDELIIDNTTRKIYLNKHLIMDELAIDSNFFSLPPGLSEMQIFSDDDTIEAFAKITERYI